MYEIKILSNKNKLFSVFINFIAIQFFYDLFNDKNIFLFSLLIHFMVFHSAYGSKFFILLSYQMTVHEFLCSNLLPLVILIFSVSSNS